MQLARKDKEELRLLKKEEKEKEKARKKQSQQIKALSFNMLDEEINIQLCNAAVLKFCKQSWSWIINKLKLVVNILHSENTFPILLRLTSFFRLVIKTERNWIQVPTKLLIILFFYSLF